MENIGSLAILLAFCFAIYAVSAALIGKWTHKPFLNLSAERAVYSVCLLLTLAACLLLYALIHGDYRLSYVASHANRSMAAIYKVASWWGGQEGSLLFWSWLLASYSAVVVYSIRRKFRDMQPYIIGVLMTAETFFLILIAFVEQPFKVLMAGKQIVDVGDGNGLNPLLQYWTMVIHPPMLYLGYVGFTVPFAFAIASLITKQPGDSWIQTTRRWTLVTWMFQTAGVLLGAHWAYSVLGWGGYWSWDAVENASLLPWITATAFLHSVMMQEKKGMMKMWNIVLISSTFFLCILGTFLTRAGIVNSVHAFARSSIGNYFVAFLAIGISGTLGLIMSRRSYLKSEARLESVLSRESTFLFNNLLLLASCFAVLWGTLFPVITETFTGEKVSVDAPFFNGVEIPVAMCLLFLTGIGPLIAWRRSSMESLQRAFLWPTVAGLTVCSTLLALGVRHFYALVSLTLCAFVASTILIEFVKGALAIHSKSGKNIAVSMLELIHRNTRRYGGYVVHLGVVLMFIGFTGAAFNQHSTAELGTGEAFRLGHYQLRLLSLQSGQNANYSWERMALTISKDQLDLGVIEPERRFYIASQQPTSEVAIRRRLNEDLYLNFAGMSADNRKTIVQAFVNPLVSWIWIGYFVVLLGTIICLVPSKARLLFPKTEVLGAGVKYAEVES
jgi:cytochrome c-type biogenesis protein CcmF